MSATRDLAVIVGPTATGKSAIAEAAAERFDAAIISVDSMQVYRSMDIGTAKPSVETRSRIDYAMVDVSDPSNDVSVQAYQEMARGHLERFLASGRRVLIAGGSGLHFRAIVDPLEFPPTDPEVRAALESLDDADARSRLIGLDPAAAEHVDLANPRRVVRALEILELTGASPTQRATSKEGEAVRSYTPRYNFSAVGVDAGERSRERVATRLTGMLNAGLLAEVATLRGHLGIAASQAVGYKEFIPVLEGSYDVDHGIERARNATHALVKRQRTFFRRDPRIVWLAWHDDEDQRVARAVETIGEMMQWTS
ncbi:MAG: tRNA (adenosine(37)-N6)-dimethylallyltransferase MiaA [Proteobacteria bacterium]|nr:tRNA (adenosine(37)-N6)-dimethylallyltransferase MiaA [Pseudomonadota bacterium]